MCRCLQVAWPSSAFTQVGCATGPAHWFVQGLPIIWHGPQGVAGIGIVNAVEVVHAFGEGQRSGRGGEEGDGAGSQQERGGSSGSQPGTSRSCGFGLRAFREWLEAPDEGLIAAATGAAGGGRGGARGGQGGKGKGKDAGSGAAAAAVAGNPDGAAGGQHQAGGGDPGESGRCTRAGSGSPTKSTQGGAAPLRYTVCGAQRELRRGALTVTGAVVGGRGTFP